MVSRRSGFVLVILPAALGAAFTFLVSTAWAGDIVLSLEEPAADSTYSGVANIRGWAVGAAGVNRVELYVDGAFKTNIPVGGRRADVGDAYPDYPNSANSGFSMAFNYSGLSAGQHTISVRAVDQEQTTEDSSAAFNVARFDNPYISDASRISLNGATVSHNSGRTLFINNMTADGKTYDIRLDWRTEMQGYAISQIIPTGDGEQDFSGTYEFKGSLVSNTCGIQAPSDLNGPLTLSQNGSQLSGNLEGVSVLGAVDAQGNFSLTTSVEETENSPCNIQSYQVLQGNFISETSILAFNVQQVGDDPACSIKCAVLYSGTFEKPGNVTTTSENPSEQTITSDLQAFTDRLKEQLRSPMSRGD
ncbi:MAG: hypothetical protein KDJ28_05825 [Candidatus Competibacteraceae bacterium]|nr:hypothetical protein [Candidatus Competibacteraceae bacterium]